MLPSQRASFSALRMATRRRFSSHPTAQQMREHTKHSEEHARATSLLWKRISYFVAFPTIAATSVWAYSLYSEHQHHMEEHPPHFVAFPFLRIRSKPFFWGDGDTSLFHNPKTNIGPDS